MPPKSAKRTPPGPGSKRAVRGRGMAAKGLALFHPEESRMKAHKDEEVTEEVWVEEEKVLMVEEKEEEVEESRKILDKLEENGDNSAKKDDDAKESNDEYEKYEKLDLEDNDPDYEPEEYAGVDYDEKEIEQDPQEGEGEIEEDPEEVVGEDERDGVDEEIEDVHDELEPEEDDEQVEEEHAEMVDAAEDEEQKEVFKERQKRKEFEIFVGGLDKDATESEMRKVFSEVGEVTEVRLMMNPQTKKNKGFAFLRFATVEQAKRACSQLKNPVIHGKQCGVTPSQGSNTLFLGNICRTWTKEGLKEKLKQHGVDNVEDLTLVEDSNSVGMNRGFAFLEFSSRAEAMDAFKRLQKRDVMLGVDRPAKVSFADSFIDPGDKIMAQVYARFTLNKMARIHYNHLPKHFYKVRTVFVDGLSSSWDEERVKELLKKYGQIEKVELARNMPSARRKDFGFVTFDSHDAAVTCAESINNEELGEGDNKAKVRARLSRPLQRSKGRHVARGDFRPARGSIRGVRSWGRPVPRGSGPRGSRAIGPREHHPLVDRGFSRPVNIRERRPVMAVPPRNRPVATLPRSYERRPPVSTYPKRNFKRDYGHREEHHPRSRATVDYSFRGTSDRRLPPYRDDFPPRLSGYPDLPRGGSSRSAGRRSYADDSYDQRYERPPPAYREGRPREYDSMSGSKRSYAAMDDAPPRYTEAGMRHSRARLDYDLGGSGPHYGDAYSDRYGRSNLGYGGSRSSMPSQDSDGLYNSRQGMGYGGGPYSGSDAGEMYSSSFGGDYMSRGSDVGGGSSYSSLYPGRGLGGSNYMGSSSESYY